MKIDSDTKERIRVGFGFLLEAYKICTGTLLSVFVIHRCDAETPADGEDVSPSECSVTDSFRPKSLIGTAALATNAVTLTAICTLYLVELCRENWLISTLDISKEHPDNFLDDIAPPIVLNTLSRWNRRYWRTSCVAGVFAVANIAVSSVFLSQNFQGSSTITAGISFTLLVMLKLWSSYQRAKKDQRNQSASSAYLSEDCSFNILDPDFVRAHGLSLTKYSAATAVEEGGEKGEKKKC